MKITKRQLRRIIREEKAKVISEGFKEEEAYLVEDILDLLIERGAVMSGSDAEAEYRDAAEYLRTAIIPALESIGGPTR